MKQSVRDNSRFTLNFWTQSDLTWELVTLAPYFMYYCYHIVCCTVTVICKLFCDWVVKNSWIEKCLTLSLDASPVTTSISQLTIIYCENCLSLYNSWFFWLTINTNLIAEYLLVLVFRHDSMRLQVKFWCRIHNHAFRFKRYFRFWSWWTDFLEFVIMVDLKGWMQIYSV